MTYRLIAPRIRWGAGFLNALDLGYPLDNVLAGDTPRDGSVQIQMPSGLEEAWTVGTDYVLQGDVRWVPPTDVLVPRATGWDGAAGVRAFLQWARDKNLCAFHPDGRNLLVSPAMNADSNGDGVVDGWVIASLPSCVTASFDAVNAAQKMAVVAGGNTGGATAFVNFSQNVYGLIAGEQYYYSAETMVSGLANGVQGYLQIYFYDANGTLLGNGPGNAITNAPSFTRVNCAAICTAPANTSYARVFFNLQVPANTGTLSAGTIWYRNAVFQRTTAPIASFIDNPGILSYLVAPMKDPAPSEPDGTRKMMLRLRNAATAYDGY